MLLTAVIVLAALALGCVVYGWFEAAWLRTRELEVAIDGLPESLDGIRIGHLSDFHLGAPLSLGNRASARAVDWVAGRRPEIVCVTGDLVSHPRGEPRLRELLARLDRPFVVLGNHDVAVTRDPFSRAAELRDLERARLLRNESAPIELRGERVSVAGIDPEAYRAQRSRPEALVDPDASFRLLLCHYPSVVDRISTGMFHLVLSGHLHAGQICLPLSRTRRLTLAHPRARFVAGLYETPTAVMHVSPGSGTTFVPFRFFARPEATELVLRRRR